MPKADTHHGGNAVAEEAFLVVFTKDTEVVEIADGEGGEEIVGQIVVGSHQAAYTHIEAEE